MTPRDVRALVAGGAVIGGALLATRAVPWALRAVEATRERLVARAEALADAEALVREGPGRRDSLARTLARLVDLAPWLVAGATDAEASAALTAHLNGLAVQSRLRVVRVEPIPDSGAAGGLRRVRARLAFEGDARGLAALLGAIESGEPLLSVGSLSIQAPDPAPGPGAPETLRIEMEVTGWHVAASEDRP